ARIVYTVESGASDSAVTADARQVADRIIERATALGTPDPSPESSSSSGASGSSDSPESSEPSGAGDETDAGSTDQPTDAGSGETADTEREASGARWIAKIGEKLRGAFRARLPLGVYFVQLEDGDTAGGLHYGGSVVTSVGYVASPMWILENRIQFDWLEAFSSKTDPLGIDLDTWRFQNDLRGWWNSIGVGMFVDYRHHGIRIGNRGGPADEVTTDTVTAGPSLVVSSKPPFAGEGRFRIRGRWAPLLDGRDGHFQLGLIMAAKHVELTVEYETLTGAHTPGQPLRQGELLMFHFGARLTL
ncbi:MAG: hypothetical protein ABEN55_14455, partial [Bradymonadaceae bacterium]